MHYLVDRSNRIVGVDQGWDACAAEQSEPGAGPTADRIIGRPIEEFLAGDATKMFVRVALDAARLRGEARRLPYRCDVKHECRRFEMVISPLEDGRVKVEHVLIEASPRVVRRPRARLDVHAGWRCSQCLSVRRVGSTEWIPSEIEPSDLLAKDVCPSCVAHLFEPASMSPPEQDGHRGERL